MLLALREVDETFKSDREIVLEAVKSIGYSLLWADEAFKSDKEIVLAAIKSDISAIKHADENFIDKLKEQGLINDEDDAYDNEDND